MRNGEKDNPTHGSVSEVLSESRTNDQLKHRTFSLHFGRDASVRGDGGTLATIIMAVLAMAKWISAAAEQGASHKQKGKT